MIETFGAYIKTITALTIFSALASMLMPEGSFRKYLELVLGILVLTAVLMPLFKLFGEDGTTFELHIFQKQAKLSGALLSADGYYDLEQKRIEEIYAASLQEKILVDLQKEFKEIDRVTVDFYENAKEENYGVLRALEITYKGAEEDRVRSFAAKRYELEEDSVVVKN